MGVRMVTSSSIILNTHQLCDDCSEKRAKLSS